MPSLPTRDDLREDWPMYAVGAFCVLIAVAVVIAVGFAIHEAIVAPHSGVVHERSYSPAYTTTDCHTSGKSTTCVPRYVPASYRFDLYAEDGSHGWRSVAPEDFARYHVGDFYPG